MDSKPKNGWQTWIWPALVLGLGVVARFWASSLGHNWDFDSFRAVADIMAQGKNVYASTSRYNYGPVWFNIIHIFDLIAARDPFIFRCLLIGLLSAVDVGIFYILWRHFGRLAATFFFLNPVSILITGYHNQFDNLAILLGLWAVLLFGDDFDRPMNRRKYYGLAILGFSLMTKHLFFAFPFWLAVKQRGLLQKCIIMAMPTVIFLAGFLPYWSGGHDGIIQHVFNYRSPAGISGLSYELFLPGILRALAGPTIYWLLFLGLFAFICRTKKGVESLLFYTAALVIASPAIANQYLAIPLAFVSVELSLFSILYVLFATIHIIAYQDGPRLLKYPCSYADLALTFLLLTVIWALWRQPILNVLKICRREVNRQFEPGG